MTKRWILICAFILPAVWVMGAGKTVPERPKSFPKVDMASGSVPFFAAIMLDVQTNQIGYIMFDGNMTDGYDRLFFWVPDDMNYRTPKSYKLNAETKRFGPIKFRPKHDQDDIDIEWSFTWAKQGPYDHFDYASGKTIKQGATYPRFWFSCDYANKPRSAGARTDARVDITIPGEISASVWTNMPAALQPWHTLNYYMSVKLLREKDNTLGHFEGLLNYGDHRVVVRTMPKETICTLVVAPYMGKPVYSNDLSWSEALVTGVNLKLDYGWYDMNWNIVCHGLNVYPRLDHHVRANPFPIARFED
jgi:hypothetical protein